MNTLAFFNNKGGVGKTSLVYHLAWMFADKGIPVLAIDLDPQSNLTSMFLPEDRLEELWKNGGAHTISDSLKPPLAGNGDILMPHIEKFAEDRLGLILGNLAFSNNEDDLSDAWTDCFAGKERGFRIISAIYRIIQLALTQHRAEIILLDVGPNLGAINRAALIAAEHVIFPLSADLFSLQGLKNLGPTLTRWRTTWGKMKRECPNTLDIALPYGHMKPMGYIVMQHGVKDNRPVKAYQRWLDKIPSVYRESILGEFEQDLPSTVDDPYNLAQLKHYRSLMPLAQEANKPMFFLKPADGAIGSHIQAVNACYQDFFNLAKKIANVVDVEIHE